MVGQQGGVSFSGEITSTFAKSGLSRAPPLPDYMGFPLGWSSEIICLLTELLGSARSCSCVLQALGVAAGPGVGKPHPSLWGSQLVGA